MSGLRLSRREFLASSAAAAAFPAIARTAAPQAKEEPFGFFLIGDTHFHAPKDAPEKLDERSDRLCGRLIDLLNKLPGTEIPKEAGGGKVLAPQGVIHAGDCIDSGDKPLLKAQETEWAAFAEFYGISGKEGRLKVPVYEVHGNHDAPHGDTLAIKKIIDRNKKRPGVNNVSKNGLHYSWDWGNVHFVNLGIVVGEVAEEKRKRRYAPMGSLDFLIADLKEKVGTSGKRVVITHHVDMRRYAQPLPVDDKKAQGMEWDPADVKGFYDALKGYNIAAILYGHTHARNVFHWAGTNQVAKPLEGVPVFNVDNSSHFAGRQQAFFYFEMRADGVFVREYGTTDAWETGSWTAQTWTAAPVKPA